MSGRDGVLMGCNCAVPADTKWRNIPGVRLSKSAISRTGLRRVLGSLRC
jgi:hypothetical protein